MVRRTFRRGLVIVFGGALAAVTWALLFSVAPSVAVLVAIALVLALFAALFVLAGAAVRSALR